MIWTTRQRSRVGTLAAIVAGEGPLVVLIHGVGLRAEAWGAQIDVLAQRFQVCAVDMPGHGESELGDHQMGLAAYSDAIAPVLDSPAIVIGHSMGAMIALDLAARYPNRVRGVCAMNAIYQRAPDAARAVAARAASLDGETVADPEATLTRWFGAQPSEARTACAQWLRGVDPAGYRAAYGVFATQDGPSQNTLEHLECPALFMTGADEPNSTPAMSQGMAAATPKGTVAVVEGAAHMMPMTHAKVVNDQLATFLEGVA